MKSEKAYSSILLPVMSMSTCLGKGKNKASLCIRKSLSEYSFISSCCHWRAVLDFGCLSLVSCNQPLSCMQPARDSLGRSSLGTLLLVMLKCTFSLFRIWLVLFFFGTMLWKGVSNPSLIQQPISGRSCHDFVNLDHFPPSPGYFWNRRVLTCLFVPYCRTHSYVFDCTLWTYLKLNYFNTTSSGAEVSRADSCSQDGQCSVLYSFCS